MYPCYTSGKGLVTLIDQLHSLFMINLNSIATLHLIFDLVIPLNMYLSLNFNVNNSHVKAAIRYLVLFSKKVKNLSYMLSPNMSKANYSTQQYTRKLM